MIITKQKNKLSISPVELLQLLHSSLDIIEIVNNFARYIQKQLSFSSVNYNHPEISEPFKLGKPGKHKFTFNLSTNTMNLGNIIISRNTCFSQPDIKQLEELLCFLIQPLKNAITHHYVVHASLHDPLTKLLNRSSLKLSIHREIKLSQRHGSPLSVLVLDIDNFKKINDSYGHLAGDKILIKIASVINNTIRETDYAFRMGGEEFLIVLNGTSEAHAKILADRLRIDIEHCHVMFEEHKLQFTISIGISHFKRSDSEHSLISRADKAMYSAKRLGKNQIALG